MKYLKNKWREIEAHMMKTVDNALFICDRCNSTEEVTIVYLNDMPKTFCRPCENALFSKKKPQGRPSIGTSKKTSLTLHPDDWNQLEERLNGKPLAQYLRELVYKDLKG